MSAELAYVMNDSLTPTKMNSKKPISPSNYPDKKSMVNAYKRMVHQVLDSPEDQAKLQKVLKEFHRTLVVEDLMEQLKPILNSPQRRKLYLAIRPLVPSRVRGEYNSLIPHVPSFEKKVVHLKQAGSRSMGFKIRGGDGPLSGSSMQYTILVKFPFSKLCYKNLIKAAFRHL